MLNMSRLCDLVNTKQIIKVSAKCETMGECLGLYLLND